MFSDTNTILKKKLKNKSFTQIENSTLGDSRISWKARGILAFMLSLPDDWDFNTQFFLNQAPDGKDSFNSGLDELEKFGYLFRTESKRDEKGRFSKSEWLICEISTIQKNDTMSENPQRKNRSGKSATTKTNPITNTDVLKDLDTKTRGSGGDGEEIRSYNILKGEMNMEEEGVDLRFKDPIRDEDVVLELGSCVVDKQEVEMFNQFKFTETEKNKYFYLRNNLSDAKEKGKLSFFAKKQKSQRLKDVVEYAKKRKPSSISGYVIHLLNNNIRLEDEMVRNNKEFLLNFITTNPWPSLKVLKMYAKFYLGESEVEMPFTIDEDSFQTLVYQKYNLIKKYN